jgi:hypothetical protein
VGESTAKSVSSTWSPDPDANPDPRDEARRDRAIQALTIRVFGEPEPAEPAREIWPGKDYELAIKVRGDRARELGRELRPIELTEVLKAACQTYVKKNGKRFTVKNLRRGLEQHERPCRRKSSIHNSA